MALTIRDLQTLYAALDDFDADTSQAFNRVLNAQRNGATASSVAAAVNAGFHRIFVLNGPDQLDSNELKQRHADVLEELRDYEHPRSTDVLEVIEVFDNTARPTNSPTFWQHYFERRNPETGRAKRQPIETFTRPPVPEQSTAPVRISALGLLLTYIGVSVFMGLSGSNREFDVQPGLLWGSLAVSAAFFGLIAYRSTRKGTLWWVDVPIIGIFSLSAAITALGETPAVIGVYLILHVLSVLVYIARGQ